MRFSITGGGDVTGSAQRAPSLGCPFDRLAVGVITAANSEKRGDVTGAVVTAGKAEKPYCAVPPLFGGPSYSPWSTRKSSTFRSIYP